MAGQEKVISRVFIRKHFNNIPIVCSKPRTKSLNGPWIDIHIQLAKKMWVLHLYFVMSLLKLNDID